MKKILLIVSLFLLVQASVFATGFDEYSEYQSADGRYLITFSQGLTVPLDEFWHQKTMLRIKDNSAVFYHRDSYEACQEKGYEGGRLFTIGASVNTSFQNLPSFQYIGFDEEECMNYYADLPTDYQAYTDDPQVWADYDVLWSQVRDVIAGITIGKPQDEDKDLDIETIESESQPEKEAQNKSGTQGQKKDKKKVSQKERTYTMVSFPGRLFWTEFPTGWSSWTLDDSDMILGSVDDSGEPPLIFIQKASTDQTAGEYLMELKNEFLDICGDDLTEEPKIISYEPEGTSRKLAGYRGKGRTPDGLGEYTVIEYVEYFGDSLYHYYTIFLSSTQAEGEDVDTTTEADFHHAIDATFVLE